MSHAGGFQDGFYRLAGAFLYLQYFQGQNHHLGSLKRATKRDFKNGKSFLKSSKRFEFNYLSARHQTPEQIYIKYPITIIDLQNIMYRINQSL